jgi:hypothetical protein
MDLAKAAAWPPGNWISLRLNVEWASVHTHRANRRNARTRSNKLTGASVIANETIAEQVGWDREILTIGLTVLIDLLPVEGFESFERMGNVLGRADAGFGKDPLKLAQIGRSERLIAAKL